MTQSDPALLALYDQRLHNSLDALREVAHELIEEHGDNFTAEMYFTAGLVEEAIKSEKREQGTGFAGISGLVAHFIFKEVRAKNAKDKTS